MGDERNWSHSGPQVPQKCQCTRWFQDSSVSPLPQPGPGLAHFLAHLLHLHRFQMYGHSPGIPDCPLPLVSQTAPSQECLVHLTHRLSFIAVSAGPSMELGTSRPQQEGRRKVLFSFFQFLYCDADTCYCNLSLLDIQHAVLPKEEINKKVLSRDFILQEQTEIVIDMAPC